MILKTFLSFFWNYLEKLQNRKQRFALSHEAKEEKFSKENLIHVATNVEVKEIAPFPSLRIINFNYNVDVVLRLKLLFRALSSNCTSAFDVLFYYVLLFAVFCSIRHRIIRFTFCWLISRSWRRSYIALPRAIADNYVEAIEKRFLSHWSFPTPHPQQSSASFVIPHASHFHTQHWLFLTWCGVFFCATCDMNAEYSNGVERTQSHRLWFSNSTFLALFPCEASPFYLWLR